MHLRAIRPMLSSSEVLYDSIVLSITLCAISRSLLNQRASDRTFVNSTLIALRADETRQAFSKMVPFYEYVSIHCA